MIHTNINKQKRYRWRLIRKSEQHRRIQPIMLEAANPFHLPNSHLCPYSHFPLYYRVFIWELSPIAGQGGARPINNILRLILLKGIILLNV